MICLLFIAGFADLSPAASSATALDHRKDRSAGFLSLTSQLDSIDLLPAPPAGGTAAYAADEEAFRVTRGLRGTPRWALAVEDADLDFPAAAETFSCAIGVQVSEKETPHLYNLLLRTKTDAYRATGAAKKFYHRLRPFVVNDGSTCTPADEPRLRKSGSYPSAHSTTGWTWALILAEIAPERADAILKRGLSFGRSRVICGAHWQSDVTAGRIIGAAVVARLHADPVFRAELAAARVEVEAARAKRLKSARNCAAEAAALAFDPKQTSRPPLSGPTTP
jgi:acid phosphatase (class A)